jgi:hypothetical protein
MSLYSERVAQDSPLFYFENNSSGVNNTGSITPSIVTGSLTTFQSTGGVQNSPHMVNADFTGEYGFEYSDSTTIFNDRVFSIAGWAYLTSGDLSGGGISGNRYIFHTGTSANGIVTSSNGIYATFNSGTTTVSGTITLDKWVHYAVTVDTTNTKLYIDGSLVSTAATPTTISMDSEVKYWMRETTAGTRRRGHSGKFDEWAVFNTALSATTIQEHVDAGFGVKINETPATATALAVDPIVSAIANVSIAETPATASAESGDHYNSTRDNFTLLDGYMSTLTLEQWYKFDAKKSITNYGTGGNVAYLYPGASRNDITDGIQGSGALRITGAAESVYAFSSAAATTEFTDDDFSLGFWTKKTTNEYANIFLAANVDVTKYLVVEWIDTGCIRVNARFNGANNMITSSTDYTDGNWHYVAVRKSGNTMQLWVDNASIGTVSVTQSMSDFVITQFGGGGAGPTELMYVSQFYIGTSANITSTQIANIYSYGTPILQASAGMPDPAFSRNDSFNNYVEAKTPKFYFKMDEGTGAPVNTGSSTLALTTQGTNFTQNISSPVYKSYNLTNRDTQFVGSWSETAGTFSTDNKQTLVVYAKFASAGINGVAGTAAFGSTSGTGMFLQQQANGTMRLRSSNGTTTEDATSTVNYADNAYHMFVGVKDGSNLILYVDGVQAAINTSATHTFSDSGQFTIGGVPNTAPAAATRNLTVDEVAVFNTAFTAQEALEIFQAVDWEMDWTASSLFVDPTYSAGFGPTIVETPMTATAELPNVFPFVPPMIVDAMFLDPNFEAIDNTINLAEPMEASAQGENPGWDIGENNQVLHMDASASFPDARVLIPGKWNASPAIAIPAEIIDPAIVTTLGALIKADSLRASSFFQLPPAYYLVTDDLWYQRLLEIDYQTETDNGIITFFNTSSDIYLAGGYGGWNAHSNRSPLQPNYGYNLYDVPLPVASAGYFDTVNRKALNLRNIALENGDREYQTGTTWSMEMMIQTTKKNQFITAAFNPGNPASGLSRKNRTGIRLKDGKVTFTGVVDSTLGMLDSNSPIAFSGFKDIADGEWHHVIIQYRSDGPDQNAPRTQVWVDGKLDIQRFGAFAYAPGQIGYNSNDIDSYSDFNISAISINRGSYVLEREIILNYLASFNIVPVKAPVATATAEIGQESKAEGNRPRALMLYFWPTASEQLSGQFGFTGFTSEGPNELTTLDYYTSPPQDYEGWDVFPVDITGRYVSELVKPEAYGVENIYLTTFSRTVNVWDRPDTKTVLVNRSLTFTDPVTNAARYIDLINDIDLSKFDMIFFKNYPNDSQEKDAFTGEEVVDAYFNLRESKLFEDFLKSLRAAVDTGLSLFVNNAQLALDLKIVDRVESVPDIDEGQSDLYAATQVPQGSGLPTDQDTYPGIGWFDTYKNNRGRIVNTLNGLTDNGGLVRTQVAFWRNVDEFRFGGTDRPFTRYEHKNAFAVGDEFVLASYGFYRRHFSDYLATPIANVKAGKVITAFANTIRRGLDEVENPYRNHAISIAISPGDVLDGRQVGGNIYVNFTEELNKLEEEGSVDLISDFWVNYAYDNGAISLEEKNALLAAQYNQDQTQYWSSDGMFILTQTQEIQDENFNRPGIQRSAAKIRKVNKNGGISFQSVASGSVWFKTSFSYQYPRAIFEVPSSITNGFRWLSNREVLEGTVLRPEAFEATAQMPNAAAIPDRITDFKAQAMVATATIEETQFSSGERQILALPMTATADIVKPGSTIGVEPMIANAILRVNSRAIVASEDQVVLQILHVDPILYIREDVIK